MPGAPRRCVTGGRANDLTSGYLALQDVVKAWRHLVEFREPRVVAGRGVRAWRHVPATHAPCRMRARKKRARVSSRSCASTRLSKIKHCSCDIVSSTWHGLACSLLKRNNVHALQNKLPLAARLRLRVHAHLSSQRRVSPRDLSSGSVFARPRVFTTTTCLCPTNLG